VAECGVVVGSTGDVGTESSVCARDTRGGGGGLEGTRLTGGAHG
jgi:hypothetical protein